MMSVRRGWRRPEGVGRRSLVLSLLLLLWGMQLPGLFPPVAGEASWARSFPVVVHPTWEVRQHILSLQVRLSEARPLSFHIDRLDGQTMFARRLTPAGTTYAGETDLSALPNGLYVLHLKAGGQIRSRLILL